MNKTIKPERTTNTSMRPPTITMRSTTQKEPGLTAQRFATMGMVKRNEELDRMGQIVVIRTRVTCCLADAVEVGFRVRMETLGSVQDGQWVEIYGTVEEVNPPSAEVRLQVEGMRLVALCRSCELVPTRMKTITEPDIPFLFEIRSGEPYAYIESLPSPAITPGFRPTGTCWRRKPRVRQRRSDPPDRPRPWPWASGTSGPSRP